MKYDGLMSNENGLLHEMLDAAEARVRANSGGGVMNDNDVRDLFEQVDQVADNLRTAFLEAMAQEVESGSLTRSTGRVRGELRWSYPYGDRKLGLSLEIRAGIPREEES